MDQKILLQNDFYFIRHGETDVNTKLNINRIDYDLPLNQKGIHQALLSRNTIAKVPFKSVCFSPIQRAVETKNILIENSKIKQIEINELSECKAIVWAEIIKFENNPKVQIDKEVEKFLIRTRLGLIKALKQDGPVLIVAHGGVHLAICYHLSIKDHPWKIGNCKLVHFYRDKNLKTQAKIIN
jgi:broad specificity phosphatase PhoE